MDLILTIATLLGGLTAIWFLFDKRYVIKSWFKLSDGKGSVRSILEISDEAFLFIDSNLNSLAKSGHEPVNESEKEACKSLLNQGLLEKSFGGKYKLSSIGKKMINQQ